MPKLSDFVNDLFDSGDYPFTIKSIEAYRPDDSTKAPSVVYKGTMKYRDKDRATNIFRRLHEKMLWQIGNDLIKLGVGPNEDVPELSDVDAVVEFMQQFVGTTANVHVKKYTDTQGTDRNDFVIKGYADAGALV